MAPALAERGIRDAVGIRRGDNHDVSHSAPSRGLESRSVRIHTHSSESQGVTLTPAAQQAPGSASAPTAPAA